MSAKNKKYRVRDRDLHIMVTDYEYELIRKRMKESGKRTLREFIVDSAINGYLIKVDYTELNNLIYEVDEKRSRRMIRYLSRYYRNNGLSIFAFNDYNAISTLPAIFLPTNSSCVG